MQDRGDWVNVRFRGALLFRYDPYARRIEIKRGPVVVTVNLDEYDLRLGIDNAVSLRYTEKD